jgi:hypothetical protein
VKTGGIALALVAAAMLFAAPVRDTRAQTPADEVETEAVQQDLRDADAVCRKHRDELTKIPHVRVVTTEIDARKDAVILVEVDDPRNIDEVTRKLPSRIEGFPVDVEETQEDQSRDASVEAGHWGGAAATPLPPTIDKYGYYHHTWLTPAMPAASPGASQ